MQYCQSEFWVVCYKICTFAQCSHITIIWLCYCFYCWCACVMVM